MSWTNYKAGLKTPTDTLTGDAALAIAGNFTAIADQLAGIPSIASSNAQPGTMVLAGFNASGGIQSATLTYNRSGSVVTIADVDNQVFTYTFGGADIDAASGNLILSGGTLFLNSNGAVPNIQSAGYAGVGFVVGANDSTSATVGIYGTAAGTAWIGLPATITTIGTGVPGGTPLIQLSPTGIGFYGASPIAKPTVAGSRVGNAALASLLTALASFGMIVNNTTA